MPAITITLVQLDALEPCVRRRDALVSAIGDWSMPVDAARAVAAGATLDDIVWVASALSRHDPDVNRRLRLWMADCAARVLRIFERDHPTDTRPRKAIVAARRCARGETDAAAGNAARDAWDAAWDVAVSAAWAAKAFARAAWAAKAAARAAAGAACDVARDAAGAVARDAGDVAWDAAMASEERWQLDRLVAWLSDEEPEDWPLDQQEDLDRARDMREVAARNFTTDDGETA